MQELDAHAEDLDLHLDPIWTNAVQFRTAYRIWTSAAQLRVGPGSRPDMTMVHDGPDGP